MRFSCRIRQEILGRRGVTLVEIVVVLVVIAILISAAALSPGFVGTERVNKVSQELLGDLQKLRHCAMTEGPDDSAPGLKGFGVRFETGHSYRLFRFNDNDANFVYNGTSEEIALPGEAAPRRRELPATVELRIRENKDLVEPVNAVLIFDHHGIPRQRYMGFQLLSIVIDNPDSGEVRKKCVSVSFNRIREGVWDEGDCREQ